MFKGKLYSEQIPAAEFVCNKKKVLLAWEEGTGKTIISIAAIDKLFELKKAKKALIICLAPNAWQWDDKVQEFSDLNVTWVRPKDKDTRQYDNVTDGSVYIVSYNIFRNDFHKLSLVDWDIVVADEAEEFSSPKSKTRKLLLALNRETNPTYRWALTGTAISKRLEQLYSIMYWVEKSFLPPWPEFERRHIVRDHFGRIRTYKGLKSLHCYIQNRVSRKGHKDMEGKLPKLLPKVHFFPKTKEYKDIEDELLKLLDEMVKTIRVDSEGNIVTQKGHKADNRIREAEESLLAFKCPHAFKLLSKTYEENSAHRHLVFSRLKGPLNNLELLLTEAGIPTFRYTGDERTGEEKKENVNRFEREGGLLLGSHAAARGLDLPFLTHVTHIDVPKSHGIHSQRNKRGIRRGSKIKSVVANYLVIEYSVEHYYLEQTKREGKLHSAVFEGTADTVEIRPQSLRQFLNEGRIPKS